MFEIWKYRVSPLSPPLCSDICMEMILDYSNHLVHLLSSESPPCSYQTVLELDSPASRP